MRSILLCLFLFLGVCTNISARAGQNHLPALPHQAAMIKALQVIDQGKWDVGEAFIGQASGTFSGQVFYWMKYSSKTQGKNAKWARVSRFMLSHDNWPGLKTMSAHAENAMPANLLNAEKVKWFQKFAPVTIDGKVTYLDALHALGQKRLFTKTLREYWTSHLFGSDGQQQFLSKYSQFISKSLHEKRLTFLLSRSYYDTALHLASRMGQGYRSLVVACKALSKSQKNVNGLIAKVPSALHAHPALVYERARWRRKKGLNDGVIELLRKAPSITKEMNGYSWWKERHIVIRRLMDQKNFAKAYDLASHHKQKEGLGLSEAEFMAGWLALRFVQKPHQAQQNFQTLYANVKTPISKSRGAYWSGRAALALSQETRAVDWFKKAAYWQTTYYGQHAYKNLQDLKQKGAMPAETKLSVPAAISVSDSIWNKWVNDERVRVMRVLYKAGLEDRAMMFLIKMLADDANRAQDFMALAKITRLMGFEKGEVKVAKKASYKGIILTKLDGKLLGYPSLSVSHQYGHINKSHIHAIIRQESEFSPVVTSPAGAMGYMQLMPATAQQVARELGLKHQKSWLKTRPKHNVRLGSTYLDGLMQQYRGSLSMSAAAYNAGPHRVKTWKSEYGDPRSQSVDEIDWVELIPFSETRNYVQRVTEAQTVYASQFAK